MERIKTYYLLDRWAIWTIIETLDPGIPDTVPVEWIPDTDTDTNDDNDYD